MNNSQKFFTAFAFAFFAYISAFFFIYTTKLNTLTLQSEDYLGTAALPFSILKEGDFDLDEYYTELTTAYPHPDNSAFTPYYLRETNGHYYTIRPLLTAVLALPVYIVPVILDLEVNIELIRIMSRIGGAFITALSAGVFYLILERFVKDRRLKYLLFIIYCFGTNSLSTSSQGLWQHGTSQFLLALGFLWIINAIKGSDHVSTRSHLFNERNITLAGLALGFAVIARPTNLLVYGIFGLYLLFANRDDQNSIKKDQSKGVIKNANSS